MGHVFPCCLSRDPPALPCEAQGPQQLSLGWAEVFPAPVGDEGLEAASLDELGRSDCIPGQASCLACSPEAVGRQ